MFPLPSGVSALHAGTVRVSMISSDYQEAKNVDTGGTSIMPNTRTASASVHVVAGGAVEWLLPLSGTCTATPAQLEVAAGAPAGVTAVRFVVDGRRVALARRPSGGLWSATARLGAGRHVLVATAIDRKGRTVSTSRSVRTCSG
jgi:hypothetical protein